MNNFNHRRIRSYVKRTGRVSTGQQRALDTLTGKFIIPFNKGLFDWDATFLRKAKCIVEIGCGMGITTAKIAVDRMDDNFVGIEIHTPGVGSLLKQIEAQSISNLRIIQHDAVDVFEQMFVPNSLDGIHIFFPDPWHKARHQKRRLIQAEFVKLLATRLGPGGYVHCATDWENYAQQMLSVFNEEVMLKNKFDNYAPRPLCRPTTKFEQRGLNLGHTIWDLIFTKVE